MTKSERRDWDAEGQRGELCIKRPLVVATLSQFLSFSLPTIVCIISERLKDSWLSTLAASIYLSSLPSVSVWPSVLRSTVYLPTNSPAAFFSETLSCPEMHTPLQTARLCVWLKFKTIMCCSKNYLTVVIFCLYVLSHHVSLSRPVLFFPQQMLNLKMNQSRGSNLQACAQACGHGEDDLLKFRNYRDSPHRNHLLCVQGPC